MKRPINKPTLALQKRIVVWPTHLAEMIEKTTVYTAMANNTRANQPSAGASTKGSFDACSAGFAVAGVGGGLNGGRYAG